MPRTAPLRRQTFMPDPITSLPHAVMQGQERLVKRFLKKGADVNTTYMSWSLLHLAVMEEHLSIVRLLLRHGADVNAQISDPCNPKRANGATPLHFAAFLGQSAIAEILIRHGADVNLKDAEGDTPAAWAAQSSQYTLCRNLHRLTK